MKQISTQSWSGSQISNHVILIVQLHGNAKPLTSRANTLIGIIAIIQLVIPVHFNASNLRCRKKKNTCVKSCITALHLFCQSRKKAGLSPGRKTLTKTRKQVRYNNIYCFPVRVYFTRSFRWYIPPYSL